MEDICSLLSYEVKKEIAERYFRFRKIIEEDTHTYKQDIITLSLQMESRIGPDLVRIYTLLQDDDLIRMFFTVTGLSERFFFDCEINTKLTFRKEIFTGKRVHGLTRKSCFKHMFFDTYASLYHHIAEYRSEFDRLGEDHATIRQQIALFYRNNDIRCILQFLRTLDGSSEVDFDAQGQIDGADGSCNLDTKLRLYPPEPVEELLPTIPAIPPVIKVGRQLKKLVFSAWSRRPGINLRRLLHPPLHS